MGSVTAVLEIGPETLRETMVWIPGGTFVMGSDHHFAEEAPAHEVTVSGFWMDRWPVTNADFAAFVRATGYMSVAERMPDPEQYPDVNPSLLVPGSLLFRRPPLEADLRNQLNWWTYVPGACWKQPGGPGTAINALERHPVVHIAYEDAQTYAAWAGKQLPTEAEWEFAARGGLSEREFAWGDDLTPNGVFMANTWQGEFPTEDQALDGFAGTSPVGTFPPNGYDLHDMIGNVWEWTRDWYGRHQRESVRPGASVRDSTSTQRLPDVQIPRKVVKGGSYLCAPNHCRRYRPAARMAQAIDTSTCHLGFRCIIRP